MVWLRWHSKTEQENQSNKLHDATELRGTAESDDYVMAGFLTPNPPFHIQLVIFSTADIKKNIDYSCF